MQRDARQPQHVEAGPRWYRVRLMLRSVYTGKRLIPAQVAHVAIRQPVSDPKISAAAKTAFGHKMIADGTSDRSGLLVGAYRVVGSYLILDPSYSTKAEAKRIERRSDGILAR